MTFSGLILWLVMNFNEFEVSGMSASIVSRASFIYDVYNRQQVIPF